MSAAATWIEQQIPGRVRDLGGFEVVRVLPAGERQRVGPFIFVDQMGPAEFGPGQGLDVRPHPHIGLATVTYLFEGALLHRDSLGTEQIIRPGDVNWMTAGAGIVHSERTPPDQRRAGSRLFGMQTWVALPIEFEQTAPRFQHYPEASLPDFQEDGVAIRLILGALYGRCSPVTTFSPTLYAALEFEPGAGLWLRPDYAERAIYPLGEGLWINGVLVPPRGLTVLTPGTTVELRADRASRAMLLGGAPLVGARWIWWNFVASDPAHIERAKADWQAQRFPRVPGETEFIPLPER